MGTNMKLLSSIIALGASSTLAAPPSVASNCANGLPSKCCPTTQTGSTAVVGNWQCAFYFDKNHYYAVTKEKLDINGAVEACQNSGGALAEIYGENMDTAIFTILNLGDGYTEHIFSARYFSLEDEWLWCPKYTNGVTVSNGCNSEMTWTNWDPTTHLYDPSYNCMIGSGILGLVILTVNEDFTDILLTLENDILREK